MGQANDSLTSRLVQQMQDRRASSEPIAARNSSAAPLASMQESIWFLEQLSPGTNAWNLGTLLRFNETLDIDALAHAIHDVQDRHESLRTRLVVRGGVPIQELGERIDLQVHDLRTLDADTREHQRAQVRSAQRRPFALENTPLWRVALVRLSDHESRLGITVHHIISDGASLNLLVRDLRELYAARREGRPAALPALRIQFADYAAWERAQRASEASRRRARTWITRLHGVAPVELPGRGTSAMDALRPAGQAECVLPASIGTRLRELCAQEDVTVFICLLAAFKLLLARYGGTDDITVGTPAANRYHRETRDVIGPFVNTIVLRTDFAGAESFRDALHLVREVVLEGLAHQDVPIGEVARALRPSESRTSRPPFNVMIVVRRGTESALVELAAPLVQAQSYTEYDLTFVIVTHGDDTMDATLLYDSARFEHTIVEQMLRHFRRILEHGAADPARPLSSIALLDEAERARLLGGSQAPEAVSAHVDGLVVEQIEAQAALTPDAIAIEFGGTCVTYGELDARANQLAYCLLAHGVLRDAPVAVLLERSPDLVITLLAVWKAGAAYVPLDPQHPAERLGYIIDDSRTAVVVTSAHLAATLPSGCAVIIVDRDALSTQPVTRPERRTHGEQLAYAIYTSGSTGKPKGVGVPHRALTNFIVSMQRTPGLTARDTLVAVTTISFDIAGLELWLPLSVGARVVLCTSEQVSDPQQLARRLDETAATMLQATPATWRMLIDAGWSGHGALTALCGGEALPVDLAHALVPKVGALWNMYGPTETTIWSAARRVTAGEAPIVVGGAVDNTQLYVLDRALESVPIGVAGELWIGGAGLARGYLGRPDLTAERFVPDPFGAPGRRMYRTGDLVRWRADGTLEFLGRLDHQVKVRGYRIELGEIENVLMADPSVQQAVVIARDAGLVAYVVPRDGFQAAATRSRLGAQLPPYMVPSALVTLDALPLSPAGKIDRKALPAPTEDAYARREYVAPRTPEEERVAHIWQELLGVSRVGVHDNFFALRGHSLLAIRLVAQMEHELGVKVSLRDVFVHGTLGELVAGLRAAPVRPRAAERPQLYASSARRARVPAPLRGIFKLEKFKPGNRQNRHNRTWWIDGPVDVVALERALTTLRERHAILRTRFFEADGVEMLEALEPGDVAHLPVLDRVDLSSLSGEELERADAEFHSRPSCRPFDFGAGEVMAAAFSSRSATRHRFTYCIHNIASDLTTMDVFTQELCELWRAFVDDPDRDPFTILPPVTLQYHHLADYLVRIADSEVGSEQRAFWRNGLEGVPPLQLPSDLPRDAVEAKRAASGGFVTFPASRRFSRIPADVLVAADRIAEGQHASIMSTLLAGMAAYISSLGTQRDLAFVTELSHRHRRGLERALGFLVNTLIVRVSTAGTPTFRELVGRTQQLVTNAFENAECDVFALAPYHVFRFKFIYMNLVPATGMGELAWPGGLAATPAPAPSVEENQLAYDVALWLGHTTDGVGLQLAYNRELFSDPVAADFLAGFVERFALLCRYPDRPCAP